MMNSTTVITGNNEANQSDHIMLKRFLQEWQIIVWITLYSLGVILNIFNHIILSKGFSDTIMLRYLKYISHADVMFCVFNLMDVVFKWWNYAPYRWVVQIYYYSIFYGSQALEVVSNFLILLLAVDRIKATKRLPQEFAQIFPQSTCGRVKFRAAVGVATTISFLCTLPLFSVYKVRAVDYKGDSVYTVLYTKPEAGQSCSGCTKIKSMFQEKVQAHMDSVYMILYIAVPKGVLFLCLLMLIVKLYAIISHSRYIRDRAEQDTATTRTISDESMSDLSLIPAILLTIVIFSVFICLEGLIKYLRFEKIIGHPQGLMMRKVVNLLLSMPDILSSAFKPVIYLALCARYRLTVRQVMVLPSCWRATFNMT